MHGEGKEDKEEEEEEAEEEEEGNIIANLPCRPRRCLVNERALATFEVFKSRRAHLAHRGGGQRNSFFWRTKRLTAKEARVGGSFTGMKKGWCFGVDWMSILGKLPDAVPADRFMREHSTAR